MRCLPVLLDLKAGAVILVGAGPAAVAKLNLLRAGGAQLRWFLPGGSDAVEAALLATRYGIRIGTGEPTAMELSGALALVSAAGAEVDERISARARAAGIPVNVVDRPDLSTFTFPAIVDRGEVVVAIGTDGAAPVLARWLRARIEAILPARIGELAALIGRHRGRVAHRRRPGSSPRRFWERVVDGPIGAAVLGGQAHEAEAALLQALDGAFDRDDRGVVHLVGAGPGDPDLLTLRALQLLQSADLILYDELVGAEVLARARREAELVFVGKRRGVPGIGQDAINRRMVVAARGGKRVVRLKGGDPFVFGRGGEELEHLQRAGVPVFVVPGVTAALGCAAQAGLPLTVRGEASRLALVSAEGIHVDWSGLADPYTTVVVYMGLASAAAVRAGLIAAGRDPRTPAAVLARGTRPDAATHIGSLDELPALAQAAGEGPAILVIGEVVTRAQPALNATLEEVAA